MLMLLLKTAHTAVQYILSGKANSGKVSNPRLAAWTLTLLNREIEVQKVQHLAAVPNALMSAEEAHECPLPDMHAPAFKTPFLLEAKYEDAKENSQEIWVVDGSSSHHSTSPLAGFAAMQASSGKIVQGTIRHHSAHAAEIAAVIAALRSADPQKDITVCTDCDWVLRAFIDWMAVWLERNMSSADQRPIAHASYLLYAWKLAEARQGKTFLFKVKAHRKNQSEISILNSAVDKLAKQAALLGVEAEWNVPTDVVNTVHPTETLQHQDLRQLQQKDASVMELLSKQRCKGFTIYTDQTRLILARKENQPEGIKGIPVLVIPSYLCEISPRARSLWNGENLKAPTHLRMVAFNGQGSRILDIQLFSKCHV
ncbi:unnamed protein product [Natator depressus]